MLSMSIAEATVTLRRPDGAPLADTEVVVEQTRHAIAFGMQHPVIGTRIKTVAQRRGAFQPRCEEIRIDRDIAFQRLRDAGATITTTESVLFEWCEAAGTDQFKQIRDLVVEEAARSERL